MERRGETGAIVYGALLGACLGALGGWGYWRARQRAPAGTRKPVGIGGMVRIGSAVVHLLRQLAELS